MHSASFPTSTRIRPRHIAGRSLPLLATLFAIVWLAACGKQQAPPPASTPEVATITIHSQRISLTTELPGRTAAFLIAEIRPQVSGIIQQRLFTEGSNVTAGQLLYQIDPAPFQAARDQALANLTAARKATDRNRAALKSSQAYVVQQQATLELARTNRRRYEELAQGGAVAQIERDKVITEAKVAEAALNSAEAQFVSSQQAIAEAEAAVQQANAALEIAKINLNYTRISAPITGRIGRSLVTVGALVNANQAAALATIQQLDPTYVDVPQSTSELLRLKQRLAHGWLQHDGNDQGPVHLLLEDGSPYAHQGTLQFRDITVDQGTGSVILRMVFPNPEAALLPGTFVRAVIEEGVKDQAILVPQQAVSRDPKGNPRVLVVKADSTVEERSLTLEKAIGDQWLVRTGLVSGERVIIEGLQRVHPGSTVKAVPFQPAAHTTPQSK